MDLQDRALLLNPDDVAALLEALELEHESHGIGNMLFCDRAVCRLAHDVLAGGNYLPLDVVEQRELEAADSAEQVGRDQGYDEGYDVGHDDGYATAKAEHHCDGCTCEAA